jgi:hypothetical protein
MGLFNWELDLSTKRLSFLHLYLFYHVILKNQEKNQYMVVIIDINTISSRQ